MSRFIGITLLLLLLFLSCGNSPTAGGSTTVEDPFVAAKIIDTGGESINNTLVQLVPTDFNPLRDSKNLIYEQMSSIDGIIQFNSLPDKDFNLFVTGYGCGAFLSDVTTNDTVIIITKPYGSIQSNSKIPSSLGLIGTPLSVSNSANPTLTEVPEGVYSSLHIEKGDSLYVSSSFAVISGEEVDADTLQGTVIPK